MKGTIAIVVSKTKETKNGYPIKLRLSYKKKSYYISLRRYTTLKDFNTITQGNRTPKRLLELKSELMSIELRARDILKEMNYFDFDEFKAYFFNEKKLVKSEYISDLFDDKISQLRRLDKLKTATMYESARNALCRFRGNIKIWEIDGRFLKAFEKYLLSKDISLTTISIYMRNLRAVINANRDMISKYPFDDYKLPKALNNKRAMLPEQLDMILGFEFNKEPDDFYLQMFKLSYYMGGVNIKDIALLKPKNIKSGYIVYNRSKTNVPVRIYILKEAESIIERYGDLEANYLFPLLTNQEPDYLLARTHSIVKSINKRLKRACESLGIPKITTYSARHSYATNLMNHGVDVVFISKTLGHASLKTTQDYLGSFTDDQLKENMEKLLKK